VHQVNLHEAKTHLSWLVAEAVVCEGFVICKPGKLLVQVTRAGGAGDFYGDPLLWVRLVPGSDCSHRPAAMPPDIRWQQRFANFCQALEQLETFFQPPALNERERQGLIKPFEYCFELGWNTLRHLLLAEGSVGLIGSRDTLRLAFRVGLIRDGEAWLAMVQDRNLTSHTCNRSTAEQVSQQVGDRHLLCFRELQLVLSERVQATAGEAVDG